MRNYLARVAAALILSTGAAIAQSDYPFASDETLFYEVSWPSGLSLGEASMTAKIETGGSETPPRWQFQLRLQAGIPGFAVADTISASATGGLCSLTLEKDVLHGKEHLRERTTFDHASGMATRARLDGDGVSEVSAGACPKDALTFLYDLRAQLARGRIPAPQTVYFGAGYAIEVEHVGREAVSVGGVALEGDHLRVSVVGPGSEHELEMVIERTGSRRPLRIQVPLELGEFSMQLTP